MKVIIDRFEGVLAICEKDNREMIELERKNIPVEAKEGDVLIVDGNIITIDADETNVRREKIEKLTKDIWQ
ncbi:hypothetical protein HMPREF1982_03124 [Clostridiales bacterium oral taxon 876 str. F0540]|nr:hypothetical protein HMPREF1982_03124 [Clostridiales bacterium oral taxon 876 str. F0540]